MHLATDLNAVNQDADLQYKMDALNRVQALIEFNLDGTIITANENFLNAVNYDLNEIQGQHHRMFCAPEYVRSPAYQQLWDQLSIGIPQSGEFHRLGKNGKDIWIQASYTPVFDYSGRVYKVVKFATDITTAKLKNAEFEGKINAISKAQAVIEFTLDGTIITANQNFLHTLNYDLSEIQGRHHSMFVDPQYVKSADYRQFWENLAQGKFQSGEFKRYGRNQKEIWINAAYNPVFDLDGKVFKVVKYATDITQQKKDLFELIDTLASTASQLAAASEELTATATQLSGNANITMKQAESTTRISEKVTAGITAVASNTEEMSVSIKDIAKSTTLGSDKTRLSMQKAKETNQIVTMLGDQSKEIGTVVKTISAIAQQTNLLALNATIEAARAGEAGKGFSVVANEVKELAKQTAKATEDISTKINTIQSSTGHAVKAIGDITLAVEEINLISTSIAAAVEEQAATTNEVARVVAESNNDVASISSSVKDVHQVATQSSIGASQSLEASRSLSELASKLGDLIRRLKN